MIAEDTTGRRQAGHADESTFLALFETITNPAYRLALAMLENRDEAADAVQEAMFRAWRKRDQLRSASAAREWFLSIVANECRNRRRALWWRVIRLERLPEVPQFPRDRVEGRIDVQRAMSRLGVDQRAALFLHYYLDLPQADVARILGISVAAAKSRIHRGLSSIKRQLDQETTHDRI